ncbi:MAG: Hemerythrin HHE cation binding domain [Rhodobacteraceae bacterium HLUCCA09]|nr:MAG: Hemerythrin HHE cation binding domain [Rhodobacteraceae bacterium HLUCCA09]
MRDAGADLALGTRDGLPDALRVLLAEFPREEWEKAGLSPLIRFWLDRHMMFRKLTVRLAADARAAIDGRADPRAHAAALSRFGGLFVGELHGHHHVEDAHYFPVLSRHDARLETGFGLLDADHHALDGHLHAFVERANAVLQADAVARHDATGRFLDGLEGFAPLLERHLTDEEDLVVPVLLKYGERGMG